MLGVMLRDFFTEYFAGDVFCEKYDALSDRRPQNLDQCYADILLMFYRRTGSVPCTCIFMLDTAMFALLLFDIELATHT